MSSKDNQVCHISVKIDGAEEIKATDTDTWKITNGVHLTTLMVDQRLDAPDTFAIQFLASSEGQKTVFDWAKEGSEIEIGLGYEKPAEIIFKGEVIYVEVEYDVEQGSFVTLRGYDHSHRLTRGFSAKSYGAGDSEDQVFSDLVSDVIQNAQESKGGSSHGLTMDRVDSTEFKSRWVPKAMTTDYDFIKWAGSSLARTSNAGQQDDKKISFAKLDINSSEVATACMEKMEGTEPLRTVRARFQISTYPSYAKVRVHGWNSKDKKAFVGEAESCSPELDGAAANGWTSGWEATGKALWGGGSSGAVYEKVMDYCETQEEADKLAQGIFDSFSLRYLTGEIDVLGFPKIIPGVVMAIKGFGDRVSGKVIVTEATHHLSATSGQPYLTSFRFCSNAAGDAK